MSRLKPWIDLDLIDLPNEEWEDVKGYDGFYRVSSLGRIKSMPRWIRAGKGMYLSREKIMKQTIGNPPNNNPTVKLSQEGVAKTFCIATLVYDAFMGQKGEGEVVCRMSKNKADCSLKNLRIKSNSESNKIGYKKSVQKNWGIESIPKNIKKNYDIENCTFSHDGKIISRKCNTCYMQKSISEYYLRKSGIPRRECKKCMIERARINRLINKN